MGRGKPVLRSGHGRGAVPFRRICRSHLEDFIARRFVPDRLHRRIDAFVARNNLNRFHRPLHELKRFIDQRAASGRRQLAGKSKETLLKLPEKK
jgi:hypothetical protein